MAIRARAARTFWTLAVAILVLPTTSAAAAQSSHEALIQVEVRDSIGLPLPDAVIEVFTFLDGGVFWEWTPVGAGDLPEGINLLRFSHDGYVPAIFSVPLRDGGKVSLRVNLRPQRDTVTRRTALTAREVNAIGLALDGRARTDIIGTRRVLERRAFEGETVTSFGALLRRARNTELNMLPASGGTFRAYAHSGVGRCSMNVMINGDRRRVFPFETFDRLFSTTDAEVIEVFPRASSLPLSYQVPNARCGMMVVWFRVP